MGEREIISNGKSQYTGKSIGTNPYNSLLENKNDDIFEISVMYPLPDLSKACCNFTELEISYYFCTIHYPSDISLGWIKFQSFTNCS
jgi:hypothetical protein